MRHSAYYLAMNAKVHPLVVALVLILTFVAIGLWMWGRGEASLIGGPAELRVDPNGHLFIQIQERLIEHDSNGDYVRTHDLQLLGVERFLGSYDFFSNGDILLRRGPDPRSFFDDVRAFQRMTNVSSVQPVTPESGLFRCNLETLACTRFGAGVDFKAANSIFIDRATDEVYVSDTSRHLLRKYSAEGAPLADPVDGFKFPNQLLIDGKHLYVTDTNHHRIRIVDPHTDNFGKEVASRHVTPEVAVRDGRRWPSHIARVGDEWWVNNMRTSMDLGRLYIFDDNWVFDRKASLPSDADPISLIAFGDEVLVTDWNNDRVHRLSRSGSLLGAFASPGLKQIFDESEAERARYERLSYAGIFLWALVIGGLFVRALVVTVSPGAAEATKDEHPAASHGNAPLQLTPDPKMIRRTRWAMRIIGFMIVFATVLFASLVSGHETGSALASKLWLPGFGMIAIFVLIAWVSRSNIESSISVRDDRLTLRDHSGRESTCSIYEASYDKSIIATRDMAVFLGQPPAAIYDREQLDSQLFPRLASANKLSAWQMQLLLIKLRHPQGLMTVLTLVGLAVYALTTFWPQQA